MTRQAEPMADDADAARRERIAQVLTDWANGDPAARDRLVPIVYDELRRLAHHYMADEREGHTLQTTALVNEAYSGWSGSTDAVARPRPLLCDGGDADAPRPGGLGAAAGAGQAGRRRLGGPPRRRRDRPEPGVDVVALDER